MSAAQFLAVIPQNLLTTTDTAQVAIANPAGVPSPPLGFPLAFPAPQLSSLFPNTARANTGPIRRADAQQAGPAAA